jgi:MFS superfamily sulfate permease-like transporter
MARQLLRPPIMSTAEATATTPPATTTESPWRADILSGFLVFLIALPLSLGIASASGFPTLSGIITAIIGGIVGAFAGGAPMTIKGPAAGLIVIALGAITDLTADSGGDNGLGYHRALAVIVVASVIQAFAGAARLGKLGDLAPTSVVHGMLTAIGVIIIGKQAHIAMGVSPHAREPIQQYLELPTTLTHMNTTVAIVGAVGVAILFAWPLIKHPMIKKIPGPLVVLLVSVPLGIVLGFEGIHDNAPPGHPLAPGAVHYGNGLVTITASLFGSLAFPDFSMITSGTSIRYVVMFLLVGSIESLLTAKAIASIDPQRRPVDLNRDLLGVGICNTICGLAGGLPMISEVVRSSANLNNGAKTRMANFFHGVFLLAFVAAAPMVIHMIPNAALAAMLVYTGTRLAHYKELTKTFSVGKEQLVIFLVTAAGCVGIDLLAGVAMGIALKFVIHLVNGAPIGSLFSARPEVKATEDEATITLHGAAIFSNYLGVKAAIVAQTAKSVVVDVSDCKLVDHTTMENLHELEGAFAAQGRKLHLRGLDAHRSLSEHPMSARKRAAAVA